MLKEKIGYTSERKLYVVEIDGVQISCSNLRMACMSWLKASRTRVFKVEIHRAQGFLHRSWLTPSKQVTDEQFRCTFLLSVES